MYEDTKVHETRVVSSTLVQEAFFFQKWRQLQDILEFRFLEDAVFCDRLLLCLRLNFISNRRIVSIISRTASVAKEFNLMFSKHVPVDRSLLS